MSGRELFVFVMGLAGAGCSLAAVIISLRDTIRKIRAKKKLAEILAQDSECQMIIANAKTKKTNRETNNEIEPLDAYYEIEAYEKCLKRGLQKLSESDKQYINEGLYQPSEAGRRAYIKTILSSCQIKVNNQVEVHN